MVVMDEALDAELFISEYIIYEEKELHKQM